MFWAGDVEKTRRREETYGLRGRSVIAKRAGVEINAVNGRT